MRLAWFRPHAEEGTGITADVEAALASRHELVRYDEGTAHDFVWQHARTPFDLTVHELADSPAHQFIWPYTLRYPGILLLRARTLQESRADALLRARRLDHLRDERRFATTTLLRGPLAAARLTLVHDGALADDLRALDPAADIRVIPLGIAPPPPAGSAGATLPTQDAPADMALKVGIRTADRVDVAGQAVQRCLQAGARVELVRDERIGALLRRCDVLVDLEWPPTGGPPAAALRGMTAGIPVVMLETEATAAWPTLDSQTWQARGFDVPDAPVAVTIESRDEEHSLMLALRRLAADPALRTRLGAAARAWIDRHANVETAVTAWDAALHAAAARPPRPLPTDWPHHLTADGSDGLRRVMDEMEIDFQFTTGN